MGTARGAVTEYARRLNDTSWVTVIGYAYVLFITLALLRYATPAHWREPMKALGLALPLMLLAAKDLAQIPDVAARLRAQRRQGANPFHWAAACLPPGLIGLIRLDRAQWRGFFYWLRRESPPARPSGLRLTFLEQGAYSTVIAFGLFSVFVELPLSAAILPLLIDDPVQVRNIHILFALGSLYTLVCLLGDRWQLRGGHHVHRHPSRPAGRCARQRAHSAVRDRRPVAQWRRKNPFRLAQAVNITPFDKPNLVLRLRPDADCTITHHGLEHTGVRYVFLYLDRPERLLTALAAHGGS
jgi:hypothetical protein